MIGDTYNASSTGSTLRKKRSAILYLMETVGIAFMLEEVLLLNPDLQQMICRRHYNSTTFRVASCLKISNRSLQYRELIYTIPC